MMANIMPHKNNFFFFGCIIPENIKSMEVEIRREEADFKDLMNDFEFVKELNKELSLKFQDFVDSIPCPTRYYTLCCI